MDNRPVVLSTLRAALLPLLPSNPKEHKPATVQPLTKFQPFDIIENIISYLNVGSLRAFSMINKEYNEEAQRFLWTSMVFTDRGYKTPREAYMDLAAFCDFAKAKASRIRSLYIKMDMSLCASLETPDLVEHDWDLRWLLREKLSALLHSTSELAKLKIIKLDDHIVLPILSRSDFPFRLQSLDLQATIYNITATPFFLSQDDIRDLTYCSDISFPYHSSVLPKSLPNLTRACGQLHILQGLVPGRPVSTVCIESQIIFPGLRHVITMLRSSTVDIIRLELRFHSNEMWDYIGGLGRLVHAVPHLRYLNLFIHSDLTTTLSMNREDYMGDFPTDIASFATALLVLFNNNIPTIDTIVFGGSLPEKFSTTLAMLTQPHRGGYCPDLRRVVFAGCELGGVIVRESGLDPWKLESGGILAPTGETIESGTKLVGMAW